ncbi:MAG: threonine ammonia-lyase [Planctomycetota bacterium]|jgi:threonine dehydratase
MTWPITFDDVLAARGRIGAHLPPTPLERFGNLLVKREDENPTHSFKVRNGLSALAALPAGVPGVVAATRGNHGLGVAWAGRTLGIPATICVPVGNSPMKNERIEALGARLVEEGADYDASVHVMKRLVADEGLAEIHSTNNRDVIAGAATLTLEIVEQAEGLDAIVCAVGGGSHSVGALTVVRERCPGVKVYGVQAAGASAIHDSWHAGERIEKDRADTFADGLATRMPYDFTFDALREGLADFVTVTDTEIAAALRELRDLTGVAPEGAGAAGLAGLRKLNLQGTVAIVMTGSNIDEDVLNRVVLNPSY